MNPIGYDIKVKSATLDRLEEMDPSGLQLAPKHNFMDIFDLSDLANLSNYYK